MVFFFYTNWRTVACEFIAVHHIVYLSRACYQVEISLIISSQLVKMSKSQLHDFSVKYASFEQLHRPIKITKHKNTVVNDSR